MQSKIYSRALRVYMESVGLFDVDFLLSVTRIQLFIWNDNASTNYVSKKENWTRTQMLPDWYEVNGK